MAPKVTGFGNGGDDSKLRKAYLESLKTTKLNIVNGSTGQNISNVKEKLSDEALLSASTFIPGFNIKTPAQRAKEQIEKDLI